MDMILEQIKEHRWLDVHWHGVWESGFSKICTYLDLDMSNV